jgi:hypothetical protein
VNGLAYRWATLLVGAAGGLHALIVRPWLLAWGVSVEERERSLPGDTLMPEAAQTTTRAVTIQAPPAAVWPWLVQMGQDRAGFYTHNWVERLLRSGIPDVHDLHPEWQQLAVGDIMRTNREIRSGHPIGWPVAVVDRERALVVRSTALPAGTYAWVLEPASPASTRLLARDRMLWPWWQRPFQLLLFEPLHAYMQTGMLQGIKARVESSPQQ